MIWKVRNKRIFNFSSILPDVVYFYLFGTQYMNGLVYYFFRTILFALLIFIFSYDSGCLSRLFSLPIFIKLGNVSFEFYLIHYLIVQSGTYFQKIIGSGNKENLVITILLYIISWGLAILSNKIVNIFEMKRIKKRVAD